MVRAKSAALAAPAVFCVRLWAVRRAGAPGVPVGVAARSALGRACASRGLAGGGSRAGLSADQRAAADVGRDLCPSMYSRRDGSPPVVGRLPAEVSPAPRTVAARRNPDAAAG